MGIHKLLSHVKNDSDIKFPYYENETKIYISNVIYFDLTYKLIEMYNQFVKHENSNNYGFASKDNDATVINRLFKYISTELHNLFSKLSNYNIAIYTFIDYKFSDANIKYNLLFKDFVNLATDKRERLNSIPMIRRDVVDSLLNEDETISLAIFDSVRCLFELISKNDKLQGADVQQFISLPFLLKRSNSAIIKGKLNQLINIGRYRYMLLRGAKYLTKRRRANRMFGFFERDEYIENNLNYTLINVFRKNDINKVKMFNHYIPFSLVLYALPLIISNIKLDHIYYMGCEIESDFAIAKHVRTYSKYCFPTIYTTDTDLLVLLSDVDCIIRMVMEQTTNHI